MSGNRPADRVIYTDGETFYEMQGNQRLVPLGLDGDPLTLPPHECPTLPQLIQSSTDSGLVVSRTTEFRVLQAYCRHLEGRLLDGYL
jgi:hypothetical protein